MTTFRVTLKACCPGRTQILDVKSDDKKSAMSKAATYANRHTKGFRRVWKSLKAELVEQGAAA